jgi:hypothetical protein
MKRIIPFVLLIVFTGILIPAKSQVVTEVAKKKWSIGMGLFTDVMMKFPSDVKARTINQGFNIFGTYNMPFGKSNFGFSIGLGVTTHNIYGDFLVNYKNDSTKLVKIPDSVDYKRSKIMLAYLEVPLEFRFKSNNDISVGLGFKAGLLVGSSSKYVGPGGITTPYGDVLKSTDKMRVKFHSVKNLESLIYGPTVRFGYKWINVNACYLLSSLFKKGSGPEVIPLSIGFTLMPF